MKSGNLNFMEPSGPRQAYNGTALPLSLFKLILHYHFKIHQIFESPHLLNYLLTSKVYFTLFILFNEECDRHASLENREHG